MTTEELVEDLIEEGVKSYKHNSRGSVNADRLNRHLPVTYDDVTFTYWREYSTFRAAQWIRGCVPEANIEVILDGNDSTIQLELTNDEQQKLNRTLYAFLDKFNKI